MEVGLDERFQVEENEHRAVFVVRQQLAALRQFFRVDRVRFQIVSYGERQGRDEHQRHEQRVSARQFGDQEDRCQRSFHHARHHAGHADERERDDRQLEAEQGVQHVDHRRAGKRADEQRRGERAADAARSVSGRHRDDF